jgi:phenylalanyl-tRNA synthetase beta chain
MNVSWNWLREYVSLSVTPQALADRLTMSGLNLGDNGVAPVGNDFCIDIEVTSNRPDCLGHLGIAREGAALFGLPFQLPAAEVKPSAAKTSSVTSVAIECPDICPRYIARVIRGVKVGPSPAWLRERLEAIGQPSVNNIVDVTNYVLMECGQPLHAFDFDKLHGQKIVVRRGKAGEKITAIDQKQYALDPSMCVIADADRPVAIGGVMGGFDTEIGSRTKNVLIEVAEFAPRSIRSTARRLKLHSPSSYRFERGIDVRQMEWASRRCCELILKVAGGELLDEPVFAGEPLPGPREPVTLRFHQIRRILGIDVPADEAVRILKTLGMTPQGAATSEKATFIPPSWRRELDREADLVEEIARVHGYEKIPQDVAVPLTLSKRTHRDRVSDRVRNALTAAGCFEAVTFSFHPESVYDLFKPRGERTKLPLDHDGWRGDVLRQSLIPSLLVSRRENEKHRTFNAQLFEIARVYLDAKPGVPEQDVEPLVIGLVSGRSFLEVKGLLQTVARAVNPAAVLTARPSEITQFAAGRGAEVLLNGKPWGYVGELDRSVTDTLDLHDAVTAAEVDLGVLEASADLVPSAGPLPQFPGIERDLNFVLDEPTTWDELEALVRSVAGPLCEATSFAGQYRGKQIPEGKKSYIIRTWYRAPDRTLTTEEVDRWQAAVIAACQEKLAAQLR